MDLTYSRMRKAILSSMILVPLIPFVLVIVVGYFYSRISIEARTEESLQRIVEDHRQMIDTFLRERRANLEFIISTESFENLSRPRELEFVYDNLQKISNAFVDLGVFNQDGLHVAYHGPHQLTGKIYRDEPWFKEVMQDGVHISDVFLGFRGYPHFIIAVARKEDDRTWVLRATIDTHIFDNMVRRVRIGKTGEGYIINATGYFQTEPRSGGKLLEPDPNRTLYLKPLEGIETFVSDDGGFFQFLADLFFPGYEGAFLYATTWLEEKPWLLVVRQEKHDAFAKLRAAMYLIGLIAVVGGTVIILLALDQTRRVIRRLRKIDAEKTGLENQLIRATRLAELGQMAAGFAHEINNPLQIIRSEQALMDFIIKDLKVKKEITNEAALEELEDSIQQIVVQVDRCANITQAILKFGRKSEPLLQNIDLREFLPEVIDMIANKAKVQGISVKQTIAGDTPPVFADKGQLQQVLLNLFNNAIDAVTERHGSKGGLLEIRAGGGEDNQVDIAVEDNGVGISPENMKKIFTPFFTTKPIGKGTGLGLSVCYGIVDSLGGVMEIASQKNEGTTFFIRLPAVGQNENGN
jgi:two-component system, NtrC family, sensor kinase